MKQRNLLEFLCTLVGQRSDQIFTISATCVLRSNLFTASRYWSAFPKLSRTTNAEAPRSCAQKSGKRSPGPTSAKLCEAPRSDCPCLRNIHRFSGCTKFPASSIVDCSASISWSGCIERWDTTFSRWVSVALGFSHGARAGRVYQRCAG